MEVTVPDIGDFTDVPVVEVLVEAGQEVAAEDPLVVLESDKASMEVPAPQAGVVEEVLVAVGDTVSEGTAIVRLSGGDGGEPPAKEEEPAPAEAEEPAPAEAHEPAPAEAHEPAPARGEDRAETDLQAEVLVLGSGPGGYSAAFRAADLGKRVVLVERHASLGGVCLNVGCIPSKALLHVAKVITEARASEGHGVAFGEPEVDVERLRTWKDEVVGKLTKGVAGMAKARDVTTVHGTGRFTGPHVLEVELADGGTQTIGFDSAILATGSRAVALPGLPDDPRVVDSTGALELPDVPARLLVVGGGIIGLEMATVHQALGSDVTVVELADQLIPGCDKDLVKPLRKAMEQRGTTFHLGVRVEGIEAGDDGLTATFAGDGAPEPATYDRVLVAVGRRVEVDGLGLDALGVTFDDERRCVPVDEQLRTNVPHVLAIGDLVGAPMLAHKASSQGHVAAEVLAGHDVAYDVRGIPSVAYTEPEVAWVGLTETEAQRDDVAYEAAVFPWAASGRALSVDAAAGSTKLLFDPETKRLLGAGIVGTNAGELLAEPGLGLEMSAEVGDLALTVHAHPTLYETVGLAAEVGEGTVTDLPPRRRRR